MGNEKNFTGIAGEFRVMSELFLRGYNPMKSFLESGADIILDNGTRIEVKTSYLNKERTRTNGRKSSARYSFHFRSPKKKLQDFSKIEFAICWGINDDVFYIIPSKEISSGAIVVTDISDSAKNKYAKFKNNWALLERY